ncbi:hypothetical protein [Actinomadura rugatobispora]|uniref:Uncharacterized protein n=1 Tax=Actinomadura rugatobispora TaxID=1994 RepID=A0ABW1A6I5_9ACTN|nr:hypothetical protein GCM10010200_018380 [Actinomadura rugatobispora]
MGLPSASAVLSPDLPCRECGRPMLAVVGDGYAYCGADRCTARALPETISRIADRLAAAAGVDPDPPGWPRPRADERPVPWITPVTGGRVWWRLVHSERLKACQRRWLCQVCGLPAPEAAAAVVDAAGDFLTPAPACPECAALAAAVCPHLVARPPHVVLATPADILSGDRPLADSTASPGPTRPWRLARPRTCYRTA